MTSSGQALLAPPRSIRQRLFAGKGALWIALIVFGLIVILMESRILRSTNGALSFPMDEAFTRLAIAKNLAFQKVWGISKYEFTSASSSILYPVLLAAVFFIFGAYPVIALLVNIAAGAALLIAVQRWLARQALSFFTQLLILLAVIFLTPLPVIVVAGMEHTLQLLLSFLFITRFYNEWAGAQKLSRLTYLYGALLVANRYEGIILVVAACILLLMKKRELAALKLGLISLVPVLAFGAIAVSKGSYFIPNPIVLPSEGPAFTFAGLYLAWLIGNTVAIGGALLAKYGQPLFKKGRRSRPPSLTALFFS